MAGNIQLINPQAILIYNGIVFGSGGVAGVTEGDYVLSHADFRVSARNIYNPSETTVEATEYTIQVQSVVTATDYHTRESALALIRGALMTPKAVLTSFGLGLDTLQSGKPTAIPDIFWGPKPLDFSVTPIGDLGSVINWTIQFQVPPCALNQITKFSPFILRSFSYSSVFSTNVEGITSRTVKGSYSVFQAQSVVGNDRDTKNNLAQDIKSSHSDLFRNFIKIPIPKGYQRTGNDWSTSQDKLVGQFVVVDRQLPGEPYFEGIVKARGSWGFRSSSKFENAGPNSGSVSIPDFAKTQHTLSMDLTVAPGVHPGVTAIMFYRTLQDKIKRLREEIKADAKDPEQKDQDITILPIHMAAVTGLFDDSRTTSFTATLMVFGANKNFLYRSLWNPLPGTDYNLWQKSLDNLNTVNPYGTTGLRENPDEDSITIDLCDNADQARVREEQIYNIGGEGEALDTLFACPKANSTYSWIQYDVQTSVVETPQVSIHKTVFGIVEKGIDNVVNHIAKGTRLVSEDAASMIENRGGMDKDFPSSDVDPTEAHGLTEMYYVLKFRGSRFGVKPIVPAIRQVGSLKVTRFSSEIDLRESSWAGCIVYGVSATIVYRINGNVVDLGRFVMNPLVPNGSKEEVDFSKKGSRDNEPTIAE